MAILVQQTRLCSLYHLKHLFNVAFLSFVVLSAPRSAAARPLLPEWNIITSSPAVANDLSLNVTLEYYVQVLTGSVDLGVLISAIDYNVTSNLGYTQIFVFNITEGADASSTQLGYVRGYTAVVSYDSTYHGLEVEAVAYNDGSLNGTIHIQGLLIAGANEVAIVGGTGDFRGVKGYGLVTLVNTTGDLVLYHHELHFM